MADIESKGAESSHVEYRNPSPSQYPTGSPHLRQIANPAPLGLFSFATTLLILSFLNVQARGVKEPNVVVGMTLACGGLTELLAGMWEFACGNTFGATVFSVYGSFWISYGIIFIPGSGILAAYADPAVAKDLHNALGFFLMAWFILTVCMFMATLRTTLLLVIIFFFLALTFMMLMIGEFTESLKATKAGGGLGIVTAALAYYAGTSGLLTPQASYFTLPVGDLPKRQ